MRFGPTINELQKAKVFYFIECIKHLSFEYEIEIHKSYEIKSLSYRNKNDFKSFMLQSNNICPFVDKLKKEIQDFKFPP